MSLIRQVRFFPDTGVALTIVASAKATTPSTLSENQNGTIVVIPVPVGTQPGDLLLAIADWAAQIIGLTITNPAGWTTVLDGSDDNIVISSIIAPASVPADYTWDISGSPGDWSRTGCMIAIRGANPTLGDSDLTTDPPDPLLTVPDLTNNIEGSILVAFNSSSTGVPIKEDAVANFPLIEQTEHVSGGSVGYAIPLNSVIAVEENLSVGVLSGRSFSFPEGSAVERTAGVIVEGV